jgi:hypothetical protein
VFVVVAMKDRNRIFGETPTIDDIIDPVNERVGGKVR